MPKLIISTEFDNIKRENNNYNLNKIILRWLPHSRGHHHCGYLIILSTLLV